MSDEGAAPGGEAPSAFSRSREAFQERNYERAAQLGGEAGARGGASVELHGMIAAALLAARRPVPALAAVERARALAPGAAWALRLEAYARCELRRFAEAVASAEEAVRLAPHDPWAHDALARARAAAGRADEARAAAREAARLAPRDADLVRRAGDAWVTQDPSAAEARYREAIALGPSSAASWDALAGALARQLRDEEASAARQRAAELDPAFAERYRRQRAFLPLLQAGAVLFLGLVALGMAARIVPPPAARVLTAALWIVALAAPVLFAIGAAVALQRGQRHPLPPDPQLADVVRRL